MHSTLIEPAWQPLPSLLVGPKSEPVFSYLGVCPYAQTLSAYSTTHCTDVVFVLPCRRWTCRLCAEAKIKRLACAVQLAQPNRLLTLTVDPSLWETPRDAWEGTRRKVPILIRELRKRFGEIEYLRVTEITRAGWPHYHLLVRSGFIPHRVVKTMWSELTGAVIVDLRKVTRSFSAYKYLVKYLSKMHRLEWTDRHVSMSRNFSPKQEWKPENPIEFAEEEFHSFHPAYFIAERYEGCTLQRLTETAHLVLKGTPHEAQATSEP